jgi:hypothetical protein
MPTTDPGGPSEVMFSSARRFVTLDPNEATAQIATR